MTMRTARLKSQWTSQYSEPEIHVADEFEELKSITIRAGDGIDESNEPKTVLYHPDDGNESEWIETDESLVIKPSR